MDEPRAKGREFIPGQSKLDMTSFFLFPCHSQLNPFQSLVPDLLESILFQLSLAEIFSLGLTSKGLFPFLSDPFLWKRRISFYGKNAQKQYQNLVQKKISKVDFFNYFFNSFLIIDTVLLTDIEQKKKISKFYFIKQLDNWGNKEFFSNYFDAKNDIKATASSQEKIVFSAGNKIGEINLEYKHNSIELKKKVGEMEDPIYTNKDESIVISPDSKTMFLVDESSDELYYDTGYPPLRRWKSRRTTDPYLDCVKIQLISNNRVLFSIGGENIIIYSFRIESTLNFQEQESFKGILHDGATMEFNPNTSLFLVPSERNSTSLFDFEKKEKLKQFPCSSKVKWNSDYTFISISSSSKTSLVNILTKSVLLLPKLNINHVDQVTLSPSGRYLFFSAANHLLSYDLIKLKLKSLYQLFGTFWIRSIQFMGKASDFLVVDTLQDIHFFSLNEFVLTK